MNLVKFTLLSRKRGESRGTGRKKCKLFYIFLQKQKEKRALCRNLYVGKGNKRKERFEKGSAYGKAGKREAFSVWGCTKPMKYCDVRMQSMQHLYHGLMSRDWEERLAAYEELTAEVERLGVRFRDPSLREAAMQDFKLLIGQLVSIHFKKYPARGTADFMRRLMRLYVWMMKPLCQVPKRLCSRLLADIYDDDDYAAQRQIRQYYARANPTCSVLESVFGCYVWMMRRVKSRMLAVLAAKDPKAARKARRKMA